MRGVRAGNDPSSLEPTAHKKATTLSDRGFWEIVDNDYFLSTLSLLMP
jgi:hypothetical protein